MNERRLNIIARYNEDVLWSRHLLGKLIIYNKGESECYSGDPLHKSDVIVKKVPNIGRETETYFRAIFENYEDLANYDSVAFMQGEPFSHCKYLYNILDQNLTKDFEYLATWPGYNKIESDNLIYEKNKHILSKLLKDENLFLSNEKKHENAAIIYMMELLDIKQNTTSNLVWGCGAQYLVSTKLLLNKNKEWWINSWNIINYMYEVLNYQSSGYAMESLWPSVWNHTNTKYFKKGTLQFRI